MSSSRFDSRILTPGWISQNLPIRNRRADLHGPARDLLGQRRAARRSRASRAISGAIQTLRSASNGGPSSRSTAWNSPRSDVDHRLEDSPHVAEVADPRTGKACTWYPLPTSQGSRSLPKSSLVRRSRSMSALPIRP
jgi:hypothetical protein